MSPIHRLPSVLASTVRRVPRCAALALVLLAGSASCSRLRGEVKDEPTTGPATPTAPTTPDELLQARLQGAAAELRATPRQSFPLPRDEVSAAPVGSANLWGGDVGNNFGSGGLGLTGIGGQGRGEGIGLGNIGAESGFGNGSGRLGSGSRMKPSQVRMGATTVSGRLPPEVIQRIVRQNFGRFRLCYENGLRQKPDLQGRVAVSFTIGTDGSISNISNTSDLADPGVVACVSKAFTNLSFPSPEGGTVKVTYPIVFSPGDPPAAAASATAGPATGASAAASAGAPPAVTSAPGDAPSPSSAPAPLVSPKAETIPPPAAVAAAPPGAEGDRWPVVVISGSQVLVDGKLAGSLRPIEEIGRLQKIDELSDVLETRRKAWETGHPGTTFPGVCGLRVEGESQALVFKSVFQTIALAGSPTILVQSAATPTTIVAVEAQVPAPVSDAGQPAAPVPPALHVSIKDDDTVGLSWKAGDVVVSESTLPLGAADLGEKLCAEWKSHGVHKDPADSRRDFLVLHAVNRTPFASVAKVASAAMTCVRDPGGGATRPAPAFGLSLSLR
jgi:hypothetical protein